MDPRLAVYALAHRRPSYVRYRTEDPLAGRDNRLGSPRATKVEVHMPLPLAAPTAADRLKALGHCADAASLQSAMREICAEFGNVTRLDIRTMIEPGKRAALCFVRLESEAQERELMSSLGVSRFGNDVLVVVDFLR